jgi:hypothetical protein
LTDILVLIARIIIIIVKGINSKEATIKVAKEAAVDFNILWENLPKKWK